MFSVKTMVDYAANAEEVSSLSFLFNAFVQKNDQLHSAREQKKYSSAIKKEKKESLLAFLKEKGWDCVPITVVEGTERVDKYLRLQEKTTKKQISESLLKDVEEKWTKEMFDVTAKSHADVSSTMVQVLIDALYCFLDENYTSKKDTLQLSHASRKVKKQKVDHESEPLILPKQLLECVQEYYKHDQTIAHCNRNIKEVNGDYKRLTRMEPVKPSSESVSDQSVEGKSKKRKAVDITAEEKEHIENLEKNKHLAFQYITRMKPDDKKIKMCINTGSSNEKTFFCLSAKARRKTKPLTQSSLKEIYRQAAIEALGRRDTDPEALYCSESSTVTQEFLKDYVASIVEKLAQYKEKNVEYTEVLSFSSLNRRKKSESEAFKNNVIESIPSEEGDYDIDVKTDYSIGEHSYTEDSDDE